MSSTTLILDPTASDVLVLDVDGADVLVLEIYQSLGPITLDTYQQIIAGCSARLILAGGATSYEMHVSGSSAAVGLTPGAEHYLQITPGN